MDRTLIHEITASLERKSILELRGLAGALSEKYVSAAAISEAEIRAAEEADRAYWTPFYALIMTGVHCRPEDKVALIRKIREINYCGLKEAKELTENPDKLPYTLWKRHHVYPPDARRELRSIREELEALGAAIEEDYNYGYFD